MTVRHEATSERQRSSQPAAGPGWTFLEWLFGIVGGVALFSGLFILFAGEDQFLGIGGDLSWRVGDISSAWAYGLLIGGGVLLLLALGMVIGAARSRRVAETRGSGLTDLLWHTGIFVVVNAFIWLQDIVLGEGLDYAYWVTIPWALGLGIHAVAYYYSRGAEETRPQRPQRLPKEEESKELQPH